MSDGCGGGEGWQWEQGPAPRPASLPSDLRRCSRATTAAPRGRQEGQDSGGGGVSYM